MKRTKIAPGVIYFQVIHQKPPGFFPSIIAISSVQRSYPGKNKHT